MDRNDLQSICLIHYHEIGLKGKNRKFFECKLKDNISKLINQNKFDITDIKRISGRLVIVLPNNDVSNLDNVFNLCKKIPGVARVSLGYKVEQNLDAMICAGKVIMNDYKLEHANFDSFKVNARRNHTSFTPNSMELNQIIGGALAESFSDIKVKMKNPTLTVHVEVIEGCAYVYGKSVAGVGGLPVGSAGKVVGLFSSGIDSPVAMWKIARRGANVIGVHFSGAPIVADDSEYLVKDIADVLHRTDCISKVYIVRIGKYQKEIALNCPTKLRIILYRRFMYKIAQQIAYIESAKALVTGESLGQVASQTLDNIRVTDAAVEYPVFRPLIGSDKQEIIDRAIDLETFPICSIQAPDCCTLFMPKNPETHAKLKYVETSEYKFDYESWIAESIQNAEIIHY